MFGVAKWALGIFIALCVAAPCAAACKDPSLNRVINLGSWEEGARLWLKSQSATTGPYLSADAGASPGITAYTDPSTAAGTGVTASTGRFTQAGAAPVEFSLAAGLGVRAYLNLTKPIIGSLYWSTSVPNGRVSDPIQIRVEMMAGAKRMGGQELVLHARDQTGHTTFNPFNFCFRPELAIVDPTDAVALRVTRLTSASDFTIGTGGSTSSFAEFRYLLDDPLKGRLFVDKDRVQSLVPESEPSEATPILAAAPVAFLAGASGGRRRNGRGALLVVALLGLAGCVEAGDRNRGTDDASGGGESGPVVSTRIRDDPSVVGDFTPTVGSLRGVVFGDAHVLVKGATVALLETSFFARTGANGTFLFTGIAPGEQRLHIDAPEYASFDGPVTIEAGKRTDLEIELVPAVDKDADFRLHPHDDWEGKTDATIFADTFTPAWLYRNPTADATREVHAPLPGLALAADAPDGQPSCLGYGMCEAWIPMPYGAVIKPGTGRVEVKIGWTQDVAAPQEIGLKVRIPANKTTSAGQLLTPRASEAVFQIPIFPREADPGHQKYTDWEFTAYMWMPPDVQHPFGPPLYDGVDLTVTITVFKSVVPYEQAHFDRWNGRTAIELLHDAPYPYSCANQDTPNQNVAWFVSGADRFVPPETAEVVGRLNWSNVPLTEGAPPAPSVSTKWTLVFGGADRAPGRFSDEPPEQTGSGAGYWTFRIVPKDVEVDQVYQKTSKWRFYVDDRDDLNNQLDCALGLRFTLTATAIRDPAK